MTRQQLLWLFIWIFIFFIIFCLLNKLQHYKYEVIEPIPTTSLQNNHLKEMHFKVIKEQNIVTLSGILASEDAKSKIVDAYGKVFQEVHYDALTVDDNVREDSLLDFFTNFADNFSNFDSGYLAYHDSSIEIDGIAEHTIVQQTLQEQIDTLNDIKVDNHLVINRHVVSEEEDIKPTEEVTIATTLDVQNALDKILKNRRVQFLYAREILTSDSKVLVDEIITLLQENAHVKLAILGHTDSDGTKKNNLRLSKRRAESIKKYMMRQEISGKRLKATGYGESKPLVSNKTLKNRRINRRVEFKVIGE